MVKYPAKKPSGLITVELSPAPVFSGGAGKASLATIYFSHYRRLQAVVDAARTGNDLLIKLAVANHDRYGSNDEKDDK